MAIVTTQQIAKFYEQYRSTSVTFTKEVVATSGLLSQYVFLKCLGEHWPCVIYSSSFDEMKVLAPANHTLIEHIAKANNIVSIRLAFKPVDKEEPVLFFVSGKVNGYSPYVQSHGSLQLVKILFTVRPPDDFVEVMGRLLEANINSKRRSEERILLSPDAMRKICLTKKEATLLIDAVPRRCILRDLSFSGAKIIIVGLAKYLVGKTCILRINMEEPRELVCISGQILRYEDVEGRKDLTAIAIKYNDETVPLIYKVHLNDYLGPKKVSAQVVSSVKTPTKPNEGVAKASVDKASEKAVEKPQEKDSGAALESSQVEDGKKTEQNTTENKEAQNTSPQDSVDDISK